MSFEKNVLIKCEKNWVFKGSHRITGVPRYNSLWFVDGLSIILSLKGWFNIIQRMN